MMRWICCMSKLVPLIGIFFSSFFLYFKKSVIMFFWISCLTFSFYFHWSVFYGQGKCIGIDSGKPQQLQLFVCCPGLPDHIFFCVSSYLWWQHRQKWKMRAFSLRITIKPHRHCVRQRHMARPIKRGKEGTVDRPFPLNMIVSSLLGWWPDVHCLLSVRG